MAKSAKHRREVYQYYRSIGYTPAQARSARNRSAARVAGDYVQDRKKFVAGKTDIKPHRPAHLDTTKAEAKRFDRTFESFNLPKAVEKDLKKHSSFLNLDLYQKRLSAAKFAFNKAGMDWGKLMRKMRKFKTLGEFFDWLNDISPGKGK